MGLQYFIGNVSPEISSDSRCVIVTLPHFLGGRIGSGEIRIGFGQRIKQELHENRKLRTVTARCPCLQRF
jgi:hypothetical protein